MKLSVKTKLDELKIDLKKITEDAARKVYTSVATLAHLTYNKAVELANQRLHSTRQSYINALHVKEEAPGIFIVYLDTSANWMEEGMPKHEMLPKLAQGPKSKVAKAGHRYVVIPMKQKTAPVNPSNVKQQDFAQMLKSTIKRHAWKTVKEGTSPATGRFTSVERIMKDQQQKLHPHLKGMVRVREYAKQGDKRPLSSQYFTFRVASELQDPSSHWVHPGTKGANIFPDLFRWAGDEMDKLMREIFEK